MELASHEYPHADVSLMDRIAGQHGNFMFPHAFFRDSSVILIDRA
jgi:hypothetical protein